MTDIENVLAADKRRAVARLQELEDEARIDAAVKKQQHAYAAADRLLERAGVLALARDIVEGRAF